MRALANDTRIFMPPLGLWTVSGGATYDPSVGIVLGSLRAEAISTWVRIPPWASRVEWHFANDQAVPGWREILVYSSNDAAALLRTPATLGLAVHATTVAPGNWIRLRVRFHPSAQIPALLHGSHIRVAR